AVPWVPGLPRRKCGVLSMLHFGWMATCNSLVVFLAWNTDNILLGRFWGADALGLYGRAYQLATLPVLQLNGRSPAWLSLPSPGCRMMPTVLPGLSSEATLCSYL